MLDVRDAHGEKAARMLDRFARLPEGAFVWTQTGDEEFFLGRLKGPWRYDDSEAARNSGIHHVRPTEWIDQPFDLKSTPRAVIDTFARGGRNLQRIRDAEAEMRTGKLWSSCRAGG